jgi:hypothetical protein
MSWFVDTYPDIRFTVENAAIGAMGSALAVFRAERDLVASGCDLVFIEYAVNDFEISANRRRASREGLLRKLLADGLRDVVLVYTYRQEMYEEMVSGQVPVTIGEYEQLAEHYGIGSLWMGLYALDEVKKGRMRWEEWLPDGLHPTYRGSLSYAQSVIVFLEKELVHDREHPTAWRAEGLPEPLDPGNWESATILPLSAVTLEGPWTIRRSTRNMWMDQILTTAAVGAKLNFTFHG